MKLNKVIVGLVACAAAVVFAGCNNANSASSGSGNSSGSGSTTPVSVAGNTYVSTDAKMGADNKMESLPEGYSICLTFTESAFTFKAIDKDGKESNEPSFSAKGTYTLEGKTLTLTGTGNNNEQGKLQGTIEGDTITFDKQEVDTDAYLSATFKKQ